MSTPLFYTEDGVEVHTADLITTVTVTIKAGLPRYGSVGFEYTAAIPSGMANQTVVGQVTDDLLTLARQQAQAVATAAWEAEMAEPAEPASPPEARRVPVMAPTGMVEVGLSGPQGASPAPGGGEPPLVNFMLADDRQPGTAYRVVVDEYEYIPASKKVALYGPGSKFAKLGTYADRADVIQALGAGWQPGRHQFGPFIITIEVLDRKATGDRYYDQRIVGAVPTAQVSQPVHNKWNWDAFWEYTRRLGLTADEVADALECPPEQFAGTKEQAIALLNEYATTKREVGGE